MLCGKKLYIYKHTSESQTAVVPYPDTQFTKQYPNDLAFNTDDLKKICLESEYECLCIIHNVKCWAEWITSWNLDCWKKYKQPQICRWCFFNDKKWKGTTGPLDEGESEEWKSWFKTQHQKNKIMESSSITSWQVEEEKVEAVTDVISWAPKSLRMVTAAMKLEDACFWGGWHAQLRTILQVSVAGHFISPMWDGDLDLWPEVK